MLDAHEYYAGSLADAEASTLVIPRTKYEAHFLVGIFENERRAVFLSGEHIYHSMPCEGTVNWQGVLIPKIQIVVDRQSLIDPAQVSAPLGAIIRMADKLVLLAQVEARGMFSSVSPIEIESGLPACKNEQRAGFLRWKIVLGSGDDRRILYEVDAAEKLAKD